MIRPLDNRVVIKPLAQEPRKSGVFVFPDTTTFSYDQPNSLREAYTRGEVMAVGKRCKGGGYGSGSVVRFSDSCGRPFEHEGEKYLFIREDDIAGIESKE